MEECDLLRSWNAFSPVKSCKYGFSIQWVTILTS